jgi:hypothetical protein
MSLRRLVFTTARRAAVGPIVKRSFTTSFVRSMSFPRSPIALSRLTLFPGEAAPTPASGANESKIKKFEGMGFSRVYGDMC